MKKLEKVAKEKLVPVYVKPKLHKKLLLIKLKNNCRTLEDALEFLTFKK